MDRPRLRPLEGYPVEHNGQKLLALRDPSFVSENVATLPPLAAAVVQLFDGMSSRDDICEEFFKRYRQKLTRPALDGLIEQLDKALLLDSDHFRQHSAKLFAEWGRAETRPAVHAGRSYPREPDKLRALLDGFFAGPNGPGKPAPGSTKLPTAIIAPHVEFSRGGAAYAWAWRDLAGASELPERIVVFGSDHNGEDAVLTLTAKHFETPLGTVKTDTAIVDALVAETANLKGGGKTLLADEHRHRGEVSLEYQMVWLRHVLGDQLDGIPVVPVLVGSFHPFIPSKIEPVTDQAIGGILSALCAKLDGKRTLWIASADLAHVGPRFGDDRPLTPEDRTALEKRDQETLKPVLAGDAQGWWNAIRAENDARHVCGLSSIYALLTAAHPGAGRLAVYGQVPADEPGSVVSMASIVFP